MTQAPIAPVLAHPAFSGLGATSRRRLEADVEVLRFRPGQTLVDGQVLSAHVYLLLQGECRLLGRERGRLNTLAKLGTGNLVGLSSLLRAAPFEEVTAAGEVIAARINDQLVVDLYGSETSFRHWCDTTLWPAEVAALLMAVLNRQAQSDHSLLRVLAVAVQQAQLVDAAAMANEQFPADRVIFLASANTADAEIGTVVNPGIPPPVARPPFGLRLISLPASLVLGANGGDKQASPPTESSLALAPELPALSHLDLGQDNPLEGFRLIEGKGPVESTLACFQMLARQLKLPFRRDAIDKVLRDSLRRGQAPNLMLCGQLAASLGLHVIAAKVPASMGTRLQVPSLLPWENGFAVAIASTGRGLTLASPEQGRVQLSPEQLEELFPEGIELLVMERSTMTPEQRFGPEWFLPAISRYRGVLLQVLMASFVVQLFTLANPLLIQVIIDKVISQRSLDTLQVLGFALVVVTLLEGVLGSLRTFLFTETTNRIDQRLGAEVIDHLLRLPLHYFDQRPVGELGSRLAELEKIRGFLTGQALTTILDAAFSVIYIVVMVIYSWVLTLVALVVLPIQIGLTLLGAPLFRRQFRQAAEENARTQSHLVEVLTGIQTVKAQNVEMISRWKWQERYGQYIARTFEKTITGTALNETGQVLQKLSQLMVLWVGASMVLRGELTLGQLIAFRIISSYVTQPLLRLSNIWQSIQELRVSFERLADVIDNPRNQTKPTRPRFPCRRCMAM